MAFNINQPLNTSFLQPTKFQLSFSRLPSTQYFLQTVNLPGVSMGEAPQNTPFKDLYRAGDKLVYDTMNISFLVDEDMRAWFDIYEWMVGMTFPNSFEDYTRLTQLNKDFGPIYSDGTLTISTNSNIPNLRVTLVGCFPIALGSIQFSASDSAENTMLSDATFRFQYYTFQRLKSKT